MIEDPIETLRLLSQAYDAVVWSPRLRQRVKHAIDRLDGSIEAACFGDNRTVVPDTEAQALALLRGTADELTAAADALDAAAQFLKDRGFIMPANVTKQAASAAHQAAQELVSA